MISRLRKYSHFSDLTHAFLVMTYFFICSKVGRMVVKCKFLKRECKIVLIYAISFQSQPFIRSFHFSVKRPIVILMIIIIIILILFFPPLFGMSGYLHFATYFKDIWYDISVSLTVFDIDPFWPNNYSLRSYLPGYYFACYRNSS